MAELQPRDTSEIHYLVVHCSDSPKATTTTEDIDQWHKDRGWVCIGYNGVIEGDGSFHVGRPDDVMPAHAEGFNHCSLGICVTGRFDEETIEEGDSQFEALVQVVAAKCKEYDIPVQQVIGHRDVYTLQGVPQAKTCPGHNLYALLPRLRERVAGYLA
jgi:hypothetical protein